MKLSEAIREGAKKRPQAHGEYYSLRGVERNSVIETEICSCALGAALEACGYKPDVESMRLVIPNGFLEHCDINLFTMVTYAGKEWPVGNLVVYLNDSLRLSREQIADAIENMGQ